MIIRRTDKYGYSRYYGGGGPAFVIKVVSAILVMAALVIGAAAFVMQRYMVYTENGGHLELPWSKKASENVPEPGDDLGLIVNGEESAEESANAEASQSAEESIVAEASQSVEESANAAASQSAEESANAAASQSAEESSGADASQSAQQGDISLPPQEPQPSLWERFTAWLAGIFKAPPAAPVSDGSTSALPQGSENSLTDPADAPSEGQIQSEGKEEQTSSSQKSEESKKTEEAEKNEAKEPLSGGLLLQHVSIGDVKGGYAEGDIKNKKGNGIMLFMKESGGKLNFVSEQSLAEELDVNTDKSTSDKVKDTIADLKEDGYYTLAYVNCFQDQKGGNESDLGLYDDDHSTWYDGEDRAWVDPSNERYQNYLVGVIKELSDAGFDEIVLNNACYPPTGKTSQLNKDCYDPDTFEDTVSSFYQKLEKELKDAESMISIISTEDAIREGYDEATGQNLKEMLRLGGRVWVDADKKDAEELDKALKDAGYPDNALGILVSSLKSEDSFNQMNLD